MGSEMCIRDSLCSLVFVHIFNEYMPEEEEKSDEDFHIVDDTDED